MARGWESKAIEAQQEEASRRAASKPPLSDSERLRRDKRRTLEMARTRAVDDLGRATAAPHRRMLEQTLEALDQQLRLL